MKVTVLGSGTFQPTPSRGCPGYLVEISDEKLLMDFGSGCLRQLSLLSLTPGCINTVLITHLHPDHTGDLIPLLFARKNIRNGINNDIALYGPPGFSSFYERLTDIYGGWICSDGYEITVHEYREGMIEIPGCQMTTLSMQHAEHSYGFRIEDSVAVLAYSGDTDYCANLVSLCRDADTAIIECTFPDTHKAAGHLTPSEACRAACEANCKEVILTHISPGTNERELIDACRRHYGGAVRIAEELKPIIPAA